ncbi:MAG: TIGR04076 family protein [Chloroflexi bacterium]|nr:TIGR04076 family protein [Chloroflexota bacterium]
MPSKVKVTVVRVMSPQDVYGDKVPAIQGKAVTVPCQMFKEGDEYIVDENANCPPGFCHWAYTDIHRDLAHLTLDGDFPWVGEKGVTLACCTDGFRPVCFRLERIK